MDHDAGVRQRIAAALLARAQEERAHRGGKAHADRADLRTNELHRVVDAHAGGNGTAGAVDVEVDVLVRILALEEEHLCNHEARGLVVHLTRKEDDAVAKEARIDVVAAFAAAGVFNDIRD